MDTYNGLRVIISTAAKTSQIPTNAANIVANGAQIINLNAPIQQEKRRQKIQATERIIHLERENPQKSRMHKQERQNTGERHKKDSPASVLWLHSRHKS